LNRIINKRACFSKFDHLVFRPQIQILTSINPTYILLFLLLSIYQNALTQGSAFDSTLVLFQGDVYFDSGEFELKLDDDTVLQTIVQKANSSGGAYFINIEAHTDSVGSLESNQILSANRANSVKQWLLQNGITDTSRIEIAHWGEGRPVADNFSDVGRQLNRRASIHLYEKIPMTTISGTLVDKETGVPIQGNIVIHTKTERDSFPTLPNGKFERLVPDETVMGIDVYSKGYFFDTKMVKTSRKKKNIFQFPLPPARPGATADINKLYYFGNKAVLLPISEPELPKVLRFMQVNDSLNIEIAGHVNHPNSPPVSKDSWNFDLSVRRAKLVYEYLIENDIDSTRIDYQGYGNYEMRYPNATTEKHQSLNRRVEIRVKE